MELSLDGLTKNFGARTAVDGIRVTMRPGVYGLLGANGAGKTTLMRMICAILAPTAGRILYDGENVADMGSDYRDLLGYLPQDFGYYPNYTARNFLLYIAALKGIPRRYAKKRAEELLGTVGLEGVADKRLKTFSGGMKQRLGIAQALLNDPRILVLDEPTAGLDPKERVRFRNLLSSLAQERIVLLSTHIVSDVEAIADWVFLMKQGRFVSQGTIHALTGEADGHVWEMPVDAGEVTEWEEKATVANLRREGSAMILRMIADERPDGRAVSVPAALEDLYLYHFPTERKGD